MVTVESDGTVVDEWSTLVRLRWPWSRVGPRKVHGITRRSLRGAPKSRRRAPRAARPPGRVGVHRPQRRVRRRLHRAGRRSRPTCRSALGRRLCTLQLSRRLDPDRQLTHGLADLCARYDVALERHHDALADARATAAVLPHLLAAHGVRDESDLDALYSPLRASA